MAKRGALNQLATSRRSSQTATTPTPGRKPGERNPEAATEAGVLAKNRDQFSGPHAGRAAGTPGGRDPATMTPKERQQAHHTSQAEAGRALQEKLGPNDQRRNMNPRKFFKRSRGRDVEGEYAPTSRMVNAQLARGELGFGGPQEQLTESYSEDLAAGAPVDYQSGKRETEEWRPQINQLQEYAQTHLGEGLMPAEEEAIRGRMRDALSASQMQAADEQSSAIAAGGLGGSGIAGARALQLQRGQQQGAQDIEREITLQDLARKGELENLAATTGRLSLGEGELSEQQREYDVGAEQKRQAQVEAGMGDIAGLESGQFTDLLEYAESARQAKAARAAARKAAEMAEPTAMETAGTVVGAIL